MSRASPPPSIPGRMEPRGDRERPCKGKRGGGGRACKKPSCKRSASPAPPAPLTLWGNGDGRSGPPQQQEQEEAEPMGQSHGGSGRLRGPGGNGGDFWSGGHPEMTQEMYCWGWFPLKIRTLLHEDPPQRGGDTVGPSGHRGTPPPVTRGHPPISGPPLHARSSIVWSPPPPPPPPRMHPLPWRSLMGNLSPWLGTRRPRGGVSSTPTFRPSPPLPGEKSRNTPPPPPHYCDITDTPEGKPPPHLPPPNSRYLYFSTADSAPIQHRGQ